MQLPDFETLNKKFLENHPKYNLKTRLHTLDLNEVRLDDVLYDYFQTTKIMLCAHENEIIRQADGFVYKICADCGQDI